MIDFIEIGACDQVTDKSLWPSVNSLNSESNVNIQEICAIDTQIPNAVGKELKKIFCED